MHISTHSESFRVIPSHSETFRNDSRQLAMLALPFKARHRLIKLKLNPDKQQPLLLPLSPTWQPLSPTWLPHATMNQPSPYTMKPSGLRYRRQYSNPHMYSRTVASTWLSSSPCSPDTSNASAKSPSVPTRTTSSGFKTSSITQNTSSKSSAYENSTAPPHRHMPPYSSIESSA